MRRIFRMFLAAGMLATGVSAAPAADVAVPEEVRFVVFGDSQLERPHIFERIVHEANLLRPHFATNTGDMILGYTDDEEQIRREWRRFLRQIEPLTMPFFPVPGNHDTGTAESHRIYGEVWGTDRHIYSYDVGHVRCIVLDSYHDGVKDRIMPEQIEWLEENLSEYADAHGGIGSTELEESSIFVFVHSAFWRYEEPHDGIAGWERIHEILLDYPVRMVIGGNTDRFHEYVWDERDGIDYVVLSSSGTFPQDNERAGFFHSFLHVSVAGTDVRTAVVKAGSVLPMDTVSIEERESLPAHGLRDQTLRIAEWNPGRPLNLALSVPVVNEADVPRTFEMQWDVPKATGVTVQPANRSARLEPGEERNLDYTIQAESAPARDLMPTLRINTLSTLRSGVVDREWEARYLATAGSHEETAIPLARDYQFSANYSLHVPPSAEAIRVSGPITIDGRIEEDAWMAARPVTQFLESGTGEDAPFATVVRFLYDDDHLYLSAWMEEPNPESLKADAEGEIPLTWNDDDIEFFLDPELGGVEHVRFFQNPAGTRFTSQPTGTPDRYDPGDYESAIHIGEDYWSIEMRIPWSGITGAVPPEPGAVWGANVWRHRQQSDPARSYWAVDAYDQGRYAFLEFR